MMGAKSTLWIFFALLRLYMSSTFLTRVSAAGTTNGNGIKESAVQQERYGVPEIEIILSRICPVSQQDLAKLRQPTSSNRLFGENCWSLPKPMTGIAGGAAVLGDTYSYNALLVIKNVGDCAGSIISSSWILTEAHCFCNRNGIVASAVFVQGRDFVTSASRYIIHPKFTMCQNSIDENDIALVELCNPIDLSTPGRKPICLSTDAGGFSPKEVIATGYGITPEHQSFQDALQKVTLNIISNAECEALLNNNRVRTPVDHSTFFCTYLPMNETCQNGFVGPIVAELSAGNWIQLAVTSFDLGCGRNDIPKVHMKVSAYKDWIVEQTMTHSPRPLTEISFKCPKYYKIDQDSSPALTRNAACQNNVMAISEGCWSQRPQHQRIVGGYNAEPNQFPYHVAILSANGFHCSGSILAENWILTAGHCVLDGTPRIDLWIRFNSIDRREGDVALIKRMIVHPNFTYVPRGEAYLANDIALIELCEPLDFKLPGVKPICFATDGSDLTVKDVIATGWGNNLTGGHINPEILQQAVLDFVSPATCKEHYNKINGAIVPEDMSTFVCTYTPGKDTCKGDSGGPIVSEISPGCWVQVGIVSYTLGPVCAKEDPAVYTRVSGFKNWILETIGYKAETVESLPRPPLYVKVIQELSVQN